MSGTRVERDSMGEVEVPAGAYYGASSRRAQLNFPISDLRFPRRFIVALGAVKKAAAETNLELGLLDDKAAGAIARAADEVIAGTLDDQFVVDIFQTGSGTSTNTNANEVIANRATQLLGGELGSGLVHPNDHVNRCQSSNDVIPSAIQLAAAQAIAEDLVPALEQLRGSLARKADEFMPVFKTGRTHLQDATPIRLGQEFDGYAGQVEEALRRARQACDELVVLPLGGTAVGTGLNAHPSFAAGVCARLAKSMRLPVREAPNHFHAQATLDALVAAHGGIRTIAVSLWKIGGDVRLMASGPITGLGELTLPAVQPGSSIMPGKVNPVIIESLTMVVARVLGNDTSIALCGQSGSLLELNVMMPLAAYCSLESISLLANASRNFAARCVDGIEATSRGPDLLEKNPIIATRLNPVIGYDAAARIVKEAYAQGRTIREVARDHGISDEVLDRALDPAAMTQPGFEGGGEG